MGEKIGGLLYKNMWTFYESPIHNNPLQAYTMYDQKGYASNVCYLGLVCEGKGHILKDFNPNIYYHGSSLTS